MDLHGFVGDAIGHLGGEKFRARSKSSRAARSRVPHLGRLPNEQAGGFDFGLHVCEHKLDGLEFSDGFAEGTPLFGISRGGFESALRETDRLGSDAYSAAIERFERDLEPLPFFAQAIFLRHFAIGKNNFRRTGRPQPHFIFVAAHAKAGERRLDEKSSYAASACSGIGLREDEIDSAFAAVGDPAFCAVQAIGFAAARGASLDGSGIGAGLRLGETKRAENFSAREALQIFMPLRVVPCRQSGQATTELVTLSATAMEASTRATSSSMST